MRIILMLAIVLSCFTVKAQEVTKVVTANDSTYSEVEQMPVFPGGEQAMFSFLQKNIHYPEEARKKKVAGRVFVNFVVNKNGGVQDVKLLRGIGSGCDEEAMRVVKMMPDWKPGLNKGEPVNVVMNLPISFSLR